MKTLLVLSALVVTALSSLSANAQIKIQDGIGVLGSGCPNRDTVSVVLTEDRQTLSILFSSYQAKTFGGSPRSPSVDRKNCDVRIPVTVPAGYQVNLLAFEYNGFQSLPWGTNGRFEAAYSFLGGNMVRAPKVFRGGTGPSNWTERDSLAAISSIWSPCSRGANLMLTVKTNVWVQSTGPEAEISLDSMDMTTENVAAIKYRVSWRRCQ